MPSVFFCDSDNRARRLYFSAYCSERFGLAHVQVPPHDVATLLSESSPGCGPRHLVACVRRLVVVHVTRQNGGLSVCMCVPGIIDRYSN